MLLRTVSLNSTVSWVTTPIRERSEARVVSRTSRPSISKAPEVTSKKRGIRCTRVLLPAPLEPTTASTSPAFTFRLMLRRISRAPSPLPSYEKLTSSNRMLLENGVTAWHQAFYELCPHYP